MKGKYFDHNMVIFDAGSDGVRALIRLGDKLLLQIGVGRTPFSAYHNAIKKRKRGDLDRFLRGT